MWCEAVHVAVHLRLLQRAGLLELLCPRGAPLRVCLCVMKTLQNYEERELGEASLPRFLR